MEIQPHSSLEMTGHPLLATASHLKLNTQTQTQTACRAGCIKPNETLNSHLKNACRASENTDYCGLITKSYVGSSLVLLAHHIKLI